MRSTPGREVLVRDCHCVVFLGQTLDSHHALFPQEYKWIGANFEGSLMKCWGWTSIPSRGGVVILLTASCDRNRHTLRLDRPLRSSADLRRSRGRNICLSVMTHMSHCPRSTRHEFEPNTVVSHLALHLIYKDIQAILPRHFPQCTICPPLLVKWITRVPVKDSSPTLSELRLRLMIL